MPPKLTKGVDTPGGFKLWGGSALVLLGLFAVIVGGAGIYVGPITVGDTRVDLFWIGVVVAALALVLVLVGIIDDLKEGNKRAEGDSKPKA